MSRLSFDEMKTMSQGGGDYFAVKAGEEATVRFLIDSYDDIQSFLVHEVKIGERYETIDCPRGNGDPLDVCPRCAQGLTPCVRVFLPIYNESSQRIEYWKRSGSWVQGNLLPIISEVVKLNKSIASQIYKIKRQGNKLDTTYTVIPIGGQDDKNKNSFGEVKDPLTLRMIKDSNYVPEEPAINNQVNNQPATRKTADIF